MNVLSPEDCGKGFTGQMVRRLRDELGLSQKDFAALFALPLGTVGTWEFRRDLAIPSEAAEKKFTQYIRDSHTKRGQLVEVRTQLMSMADWK